MPRYKEYNETRLIKKAMHEFWSNGYGATSLSVLTRKMRINKFSFYEAFESKENLLLLTMRFYLDRFFRPFLARLKTEKNITGYFLMLLESGDKRIPGCYILTVTAETGERIPGAVEILKEYLDDLEDVVRYLVLDFHPEASDTEVEIRIRQLMALCTSIPLLGSLKPARECIEYAEQVLTLMEINP